MAEISRDKFELNKLNVQRSNKPEQDIVGPTTPDPTPEQPPAPTEGQKTSYNNHPGEVLGRSQVKKININKLSAEQAENIRKDLAFFGKNTDLVNKSEKIYDATYKNAKNDQATDPYKLATQVQMGYVNEMNKD